MAEKSKKSGKILNKNSVVIVGIGRVGLPLALFLAEKGYKVYGLDVDKEKINLITIFGKMKCTKEN